MRGSRPPRLAFGGTIEVLLGLTVLGAVALSVLALWRGPEQPPAPKKPSDEGPPDGG
jgi:hypothetical protein